MAAITQYMVAYNFRIIARSIILLLGLIIFSITFISGIDEIKGSIDGIIMNSPYFLAWLALLSILLVSWAWELVGGITIFIVALGSLYFFYFYNSTYSFSALILVFTLLILSFSLIASWYLSHDEPI